MSRKALDRIEFTEPATIAEAIEALEDLRARLGNDAQVRVLGFFGMHRDGQHVKAITAHRP